VFLVTYGVELDHIHILDGQFYSLDVCKAGYNLTHWSTNLFGTWQMSTIWADTVDQARDAARKFVYAGLSDKADLYGLHDCVYNYESVKVLHTMSVVSVCTVGMEVVSIFTPETDCSAGSYREQTTEQFVKDLSYLMCYE